MNGNDRIVNTTLQTATTTATGGWTDVGRKGLRTYQAVLTCSSGNCTGTVVWEGSNDQSNAVTLATTTFSSAASPQTDGFASEAPWLYVRTRVTAITGTSASISTYMAS